MPKNKLDDERLPKACEEFKVLLGSVTAEAVQGALKADKNKACTAIACARRYGQRQTTERAVVPVLAARASIREETS